MCLLFETIRIENYVAEALVYHQRRVDRSRFALFGEQNPLVLSDLIDTEAIPGDGLYKCRIIYGKDFKSITFLPYVPRVISRMKMADAKGISYEHKFADRTAFDQLRNENPDFDELILLQDGLITDTTYTNIALWDGTAWFTPDKPLLNGTRRQRLMDEGKITAIPIHRDELIKFKKISLINSMLDLDQCVVQVNDQTIIA
jgi:4-amino-4-deoxychorismate lyase